MVLMVPKRLSIVSRSYQALYALYHFQKFEEKIVAALCGFIILSQI